SPDEYVGTIQGNKRALSYIRASFGGPGRSNQITRLNLSDKSEAGSRTPEREGEKPDYYRSERGNRSLVYVSEFTRTGSDKSDPRDFSFERAKENGATFAKGLILIVVLCLCTQSV